MSSSNKFTSVSYQLEGSYKPVETLGFAETLQLPSASDNSILRLKIIDSEFLYVYLAV